MKIYPALTGSQDIIPIPFSQQLYEAGIPNPILTSGTWDSE